MKDPRVQRQLTRLRRDLTCAMGVRAPAALALLQERDEGLYPALWRAEIEALLEQHGACPGRHGVPLSLPTQDDEGEWHTPTYNPSTEAAALLCWLQRLRVQLGRELEVFAPRQKRGGDPLWKRTSDHFAAQLDEHMALLGWERAARERAKKVFRRACAAKHGLESTRHLPASVYGREVDTWLLEIAMVGVEAALSKAVASVERWSGSDEVEVKGLKPRRAA
ncbi:MAG: hypothetical protein CMH57_02510 [Myxococcales bacterium]|nr:hypothetical protein [Myxococcales bacterium]